MANVNRFYIRDRCRTRCRPNVRTLLENWASSWTTSRRSYGFRWLITESLKRISLRGGGVAGAGTEG